METPSSERRLHPLMVAAALSIIIFCAVGVAALTGLLPLTKRPGNPDPVASQPADPSPVAPAPAAPVETVTAKPEVVPAPAPARPKPHRVAAEHYAAPARAPVCYSCGTVVAVNAIKEQGNASGVGAVGGAVAGGVVGHQFGKGHGKDALTVLGALGGALAGNQAEKTVRATLRYDVVVRMEDGSTQTVSDTTPPPFSTGDKVRLENGTLVHAN